MKIPSWLWCGACVVVGSAACSEPDDAASRYPETCREARDQAVADTGATPADGPQTLHVDGDRHQPWPAYCSGMAGDQPSEYLEVSEASTFSQVGDGAAVTTTRYRRLRIDPVRLAIDPLDDAFATTTGTLLPPGRTHIPAGWAELRGPVAPTSLPAAARADLAGTGFSLAVEVGDAQLGFFCTRSIGGAEGAATIELATDLSSFALEARDAAAAGSTRVVADCARMSRDAPVEAAWPLAYLRG